MSFTQPAGDLLCFLGRGTRQQVEYFVDAAPAGPVQNVRKSHTERSIAAEHVRNVVRKLFVDLLDNKLQSFLNCCIMSCIALKSDKAHML